MKRARLDWIGLILIAWSVLGRALVMAEPFPGWDADPTRVAIAIVGLGPTGSLALDALAWLGAGLAFLGRRGKVSDPLAMLALVGALFIVGRTLLLDRDNAEAIRIASSWGAGWVSFAALLSSACRPLVRTVVGSVLLACVAMLAAKAFLQVFVEHPLMLAQFDANRAQNLMSQGFEPGSAQALIYERRLRQPDPTGWFGLSNVLATFAAAAGVAMLFAAARCERITRTALLVGAAALGFVLVLIGSKAGYGVAALGLAGGVVGRVLPRRWAFVALLVLLTLPTLAVIGRGIAGVPEGERSLLFRWFYAQGAARITLDSLPAGVGPAGFQDAYMLAKPAPATEDVSSPHSIVLDYAATLGLFGVPVVVALLWAAVRVTRNLSEKSRIATSPERLRVSRPAIMLAILAPIFLGVWLESEATTIEGAFARLLGASAWAGLALLLVRGGQPNRKTLAVAGFVILAHSELDMALSLPGSALLGLALVALASSPGRWRRPALPRWLPVGAAVAGLAMLGVLAPGVWRWESLLRESSERLSALVAEAEEPRAFPPSEAERFAFESRLQEATAQAFEALSQAAQIMPADARAASEAARIGVLLASGHAAGGQEEHATALLERADGLLVASIEVRDRAGIRAQLGSLRLFRAERARASGGSEDAVRELVESGLAQFERACELAPPNPRHPATLALTLAQWGQPDRARGWAERAIELDRQTALDPLSALPEEVRRRLERLARGS